MLENPEITFHGWSGFSVETGSAKIVFDPFFRPYCGADFCTLEDFAGADAVCVTHGHGDHYLDTAAVVKHTNARVVASPAVCKFLHKRGKIPESNLQKVEPGQTARIAGAEITAFSWRHRNITVRQGLFGGGPIMGSQWAINALVKTPFFAPYHGFHISIPGFKTILNYGEGFNMELVVAECVALGERFKPNIVIAAGQVFFENFVADGVAALNPDTVILHHPHQKLYEKINVKSATPEVFVASVKEKSPNVEIHYAEPGFTWPDLLEGKSVSA
jgi:L-ascorbate metabolism protein UlaG (beta-lactamase superfamily)